MHRREIPIARPCDARWDEMQGDAFRRFCRHCRKHVHDLSALDESEARRLLDAARGLSLCVQYRTDARGRLLFHEPQPVALRRSRRGTAIAAGVATSVASSLAACATPVADDTTDASVFDTDAGLAFPADDLSAFGFAGASAANDTDTPAPEALPTPVVRVPIPEVADDFFVRRPVGTRPTGLQHDDGTPAHTDSGEPRVVYGYGGDIALRPQLRGRVMIGKRVAEVRATMGEPMWIPRDSDAPEDSDD